MQRDWRVEIEIEVFSNNVACSAPIFISTSNVGNISLPTRQGFDNTSQVCTTLFFWYAVGMAIGSCYSWSSNTKFVSSAYVLAEDRNIHSKPLRPVQIIVSCRTITCDRSLIT